MSQPTYFYRVVFWTNAVTGERVNLAVYVYGDAIPFTWRQLTDWRRAATFADWDELSMRECVERMRTEVEDWTVLAKHSRWRHEMSIVQIAPPLPGMVFGKTADELVERLAKGMLV